MITTQRYLEKDTHFDGLCRYCKTPDIRPPRRTFCSPECVHEYRLRTSSQYIRECLYKRDKGICSLCNMDTKTIKEALLDTDCLCTKKRSRYRKKYVKGDVIHNEICIDIRNANKLGLKRKVWRRKNGGGLWDADHIVRVEFGGGCCGLDNLRTLCLPCHKLVT